MGVRLPTILGKAIQDVWLTLNQEYNEEKITDLIECIHRMEDLMDDLHNNSKLRPIVDDGAGDIPLWNKASVACVNSEGTAKTAGNRQVLPRQGLYECSVVVRRGIQISTSARVLLPQQILGELW